MMINKRLINMVPSSKRFILNKTLVSWISLLAGIQLWFMAAGILERAEQGTLTARYTVASVAACLVMIAVRFSLTHLSAHLTHKATACVKATLRAAVYQKLRRLGSRYTDAFSTSEVVQLSGEGIEQLETYFGNYLPQFAYAILAPLTLLVVYLPISPLTAFTLFVCVPLIPVAIMAVQKFAKRLLGKYWKAYSNLGDSFLENLQGLTTLKVYGADEYRHKTMNDEAEHFRKITMKVLTMQLNSVTIMDLVAYGGTALGSLLCVRAFLLGQVSMGEALAMILLASEFFLAMRTLGSYFHVAMNGIAASDRIFQLLDLPEQKGGAVEAKNGDIVLEKLSFSYNSGKQVLNSINVKIPQGGFVSVCGESGCGKSTLAALISGSYANYKGSIRLCGTELRELSKESLRNKVTVVSFGSYVFSGTVRKTLLEGNPEAEEGELLNALKQVNLLDYVQTQGGLDMALTECASNLSGGQRQRLSLARALLKNSDVYIFDEATSNIDAESEGKILEAIYSLKGKHTVLLISHRLANAIEADEIIFLKNGKVSEQGRHKALLEKKGGYAEMFRAQYELENLGMEDLLCDARG